jgi:hypothetical protein
MEDVAGESVGEVGELFATVPSLTRSIMMIIIKAV